VNIIAPVFRLYLATLLTVAEISQQQTTQQFFQLVTPQNAVTNVEVEAELQSVASE